MRQYVDSIMQNSMLSYRPTAELSHSWGSAESLSVCKCMLTQQRSIIPLMYEHALYSAAATKDREHFVTQLQNRLHQLQ